ncbi:DUF3347 domain-containing protein [Pedobacter sp. L105]|uniref:DUF3347 domain-containing protein n=1 Tax=Pedobacter sp. L105 TaxID=1641871 RepID=UPI00131E4424|nr:DUF3347 domain-containing protein [Pedobacter sp. L105]
MKKIIFILTLLTTTFSLQTFATNSAASPLSALLNSYFDVKNALVNSDGIAAAAKSKELLATIEAVDVKNLSTDDAKVFLPLKEKLSVSAKAIAGAKDIAAQRSSFANLSTDFYALTKNVKISSTPVYYAYCPMTKNYWLSNDQVIKNPYFGKQMLSCGTVKDTLI